MRFPLVPLIGVSRFVGKAAFVRHPGSRDVQTGRRQGRSEGGSEACRRWYVELPSDAGTTRAARFNIPLGAEVVEWQTRTFEGRVAQAVRVQVPPSAPNQACSYRRLTRRCLLIR